jgi:hypothetical protein
MKFFKVIFGIAVLGVPLSLALTPVNQASALLGANDTVTVINTAANPVPTKAVGITNVAGTIGVTNTAANPVPTKAVGITNVAGTIGIDSANNAVTSGDVTQLLYGGSLTSGAVPAVNSPLLNVAAMKQVRVHVSCFDGCTGAVADIVAFAVDPETGTSYELFNDRGGVASGNVVTFDKVYDIPGDDLTVRVFGSCAGEGCLRANIAVVGRSN